METLENDRTLAEGRRTETHSVYLAGATLPGISLFAVAFIVAYRYATFFSFNSPAPLWFPDSVLLCALLLVPRRQWWLYLLTALPLRLALESAAPIWFVLVAFVNDSLKAAMSAYVLQRFTAGPLRLNTLRQLAIFIGAAVMTVPALSALMGAAARDAAGYTFSSSFFNWFVGDAIAALIVTPTLLYWCWKGWRRVNAKIGEIALLVVGFAACLYFTFFVPHSSYSPIVLYAPVPFLIWAATRLGPIGISTANSALAIVSMISAVEGKGPFSANYSDHSVLSMQLFLAVISLPTLVVAILIEQRRDIENSLRESQEHLKQLHDRTQLLAHKLINSQEEERRRIARDLHDHIGQSLALLTVTLEQRRYELLSKTGVEEPLINDLRAQVDQIGKDVHELSHQLHSSTLHHLGLQAALKALCRDTARQHHIVVDFQANDTDGVPQEISLCAFRVAQEALNNAVRHGRAQQIEVAIQKLGNVLRVSISDTGIGFDPAVLSDGLGLISMQERLRMLGGQLVIKSKPGNGTEIGAEVPLREAA